MTTLDEFLSTLDPKTAKRFKTAQEVEIERLPLASLGLTRALGGGIAKGRITLVYGNQSSGKSLLAQQSIALFQKQGLVCAYADVEGAYDKEWAARLGVNNDELILFSSKSSGRLEMDIAPLLESKIDVLVIDSISDIMPEAFVSKDGELNDQSDRKQIGAHAKAITALINAVLFLNQDTAVIVISQMTSSFGSMHVSFVPHGGKKVLFAASQIVRLTSSGTENNQIKGPLDIGGRVVSSPIGRKVSALVEKNKLGRSHTTCEYEMYYAGEHVGIDSVGEHINIAIDLGIITKAGAWLRWEESQWQGKENTVDHFRTNQDDFDKLKEQINERG